MEYCDLRESCLIFINYYIFQKLKTISIFPSSTLNFTQGFPSVLAGLRVWKDLIPYFTDISSS